MRIARRLIVGAAALGVLLSPAAAHAFYGNGADLISADYERLEQGDDSTVFAAVSADGRYVAIQTRSRNFFADDDPDPLGRYRAGGVFRFNLETRALEKVADGDLFDEETNSFLRRGASNPSISADGRFIVFATAEPILAADTNDNVDVYVRDMSVPHTDAGAYELVSARDGSVTPAAYGPPQFPFPGSNFGSDVSRGVAISGDGRHVVFRTNEVSDLPARPSADVPAGQVFLRDRLLQTTRLVTTNSSSGEPAGGALGAVISADGSAVAWTGSNAPAQTRFLGGETPESGVHYYLYKRVADGPAAPTRRITGVSDPDDPACPPAAVTQFDQTSTGPCYGPITDQESLRSSIISQLPALSGDGYTVAYLTGSGPRPLGFTDPGLDLFVADMHPGVTRKQGTVELTRGGSNNSDTATSSPMSGVAMSADGTHLALTSARTNFQLDALEPTGSARRVPGVRELYVVDLEHRTLDRVARSYVGEDTDGDVAVAATLSADGEVVAFTSFAGNLFFGDANQRPDAFVATREPEPEGPPPPPDDGPPGTIRPEDLTARVVGRGQAMIRLRISVPAAGGVKAVANAGVGRPRRRATLATGTARAGAEGFVEIALRVVRRWRPELRRRKRIFSIVDLSFVASAGGARTENEVGVTFKRRPSR
jgi:Tol biopolymer transport system component